IEILTKALFHLDFPAWANDNHLLTSICIAHTLLAIWHSHFNFVFHERPFNVQAVINMARSFLLTSFHDQILIASPSPFPLLHF
ncbi:MAG: hypothetical protein EXX96DRAFT_458058, partial [Benjaminiella poitrasii]